jgi:hypothetical protein
MRTQNYIDTKAKEWLDEYKAWLESGIDPKWRAKITNMDRHLEHAEKTIRDWYAEE